MNSTQDSHAPMRDSPSFAGYKKKQNCDETPVQQTTLSSRTNALYKCVTNAHRLSETISHRGRWGDRINVMSPFKQRRRKPERATSGLSSQCLAPHLENEGSCVRDASAREGETQFLIVAEGTLVDPPAVYRDQRDLRKVISAARSCGVSSSKRRSTSPASPL